MINLTQLPLLIKFFLEFLIRSRTFKDSETGFRLAVQVCELALQELPLGYELSNILGPEPLGDACRDVFGRKAEGFKTFPCNDEPHVTTSSDGSTSDGEPIAHDEPDQDSSSKIELIDEDDTSKTVTSNGRGGDWGTTTEDQAWTVSRRQRRAYIQLYVDSSYLATARARCADAVQSST